MTTTEPIYDLALTGGTLLDPGQGIINGRRDIAFKDGLVAHIAERIDPILAAISVDCSPMPKRILPKIFRGNGIMEACQT